MSSDKTQKSKHESRPLHTLQCINLNKYSTGIKTETPPTAQRLTFNVSMSFNEAHVSKHKPPPPKSV